MCGVRDYLQKTTIPWHESYIISVIIGYEPAQPAVQPGPVLTAEDSAKLTR